MEKDTFYQLRICILILSTICLEQIFNIKMLSLFIWISFTTYALLKKHVKTRFRSNRDKVKLIFILVITYYILYLLLGLIVGYQSSPYSLKIIEIFKNIIFIVGIKLMQEYVRSRMLNSFSFSFPYTISITLLFALLSLSFSDFLTSFTTLETFLEYLLATLVPQLVESCLLSYLSLNGGYLLTISYTAIHSFALILLPIFPKVDWFIQTTSRYVLALFIFLSVSYEHMIHVSKENRQRLRKENPLKTIPVFLCILLLIGFVAGLFPYKPVAVVSNSMSPTFSRGDICIVKQLKEEEIYLLSKGDIIQYQFNNYMVIHRILEINKQNNEISFTTKGDHNNTADLLEVSQDQIIGSVQFIVPYLGYPSVWFHELLESKRNK